MERSGSSFRKKNNRFNNKNFKEDDFNFDQSKMLLPVDKEEESEALSESFSQQKSKELLSNSIYQQNNQSRQTVKISSVAKKPTIEQYRDLRKDLINFNNA